MSEGTMREEDNPSAHVISSNDSSGEDRQEQKSRQAQLERSGDKMPALSTSQPELCISPTDHLDQPSSSKVLEGG